MVMEESAGMEIVASIESHASPHVRVATPGQARHAGQDGIDRVGGQ